MYLNFVITFLGLASITTGFLFTDLIIGNGTDFLLFNLNLPISNYLDFHLGNLYINTLALFYTLIGIILSLILFNPRIDYFVINISQTYFTSSLSNYKISYKDIYIFFANKWFINAIYNKLIAYPLLKIGYNFTFLTMDQGYIISILGQQYFSQFVQFLFYVFYNILSSKRLNELILFLFMAYFFFTLIYFNSLILATQPIFFLNFFFAVPKKKNSKKKYNKIQKTLNKKKLSKIFNLNFC